ncbi:MAG: tetratricopeptide repeat protein [Treponema sp.]|jgi:tetratricopeptide (TPR) repeat protein|nr:tetratricopeptide repeat protein [Treponema sp.]
MKTQYFWKRVRFWMVLFLITPLLLAAEPNRRFALVIGNSKYQYVEKLTNPENDATDVAAKLRKLGYQTELKLNVGNAEMGRAIADYVRRLASSQDNEGFFWYAGHGVQLNSENYLLPVDIKAEDDVAVKYGSYPLNQLIESFEQIARNKVNVVFLDACRNNPFKNTTGGRRGVSRGLAVVENIPPDLFILFSTSAGTEASDGERGKRNSPFAEAFLKHIESPLDLSLVVRSITRETLSLTNNQQRPYQEGSIISMDYYSLNPQVTPPVTPPVVLVPAPVTPPGMTAEEYYKRGQEYRNKGDYNRAITEYTEAIRLNQKYTDAYFVRGIAYELKKDYDRAMVDYTEVIRLNPKFANAYYGRGNTYNNKGEYDRAIAEYTEAIKFNQKYTDAYYARGEMYKNKGEYDRAIADYTEAIRLDPEYAAAYNSRGVVYNDFKGEYDRAIAEYTEAISLNPKYVFAYYNRGLAYYNKGDNDRAIADYTQAIRINPNYAAAYYSRGLAYYNKKDYDRAIADYTQAIRINPNYAEAYNNRGTTYYNKKDYTRAGADWTEALRLNPNHTHARNNLEILRKMGY